MKYQGKRCARGVSRKTFVVMLALVLVIGCAVGGTVAWLVDQTNAVTNTFTFGDINIELTETMPEKNEAKIIPGVDIEKNPKVTVLKDSEACWLFVEVKEEGAFIANKVTYSIADGWTKLTGVTGADNVYYREVSAEDAKKGVEYNVLAGSEDYPNGVVSVSEDLTKSDIKDAERPTLTFTAYAVQREGIDTAAAAWEKTSTATNS